MTRGKNLQIVNYINRPHLYTAASIKIKEKGEIVQGYSVLHVLVRVFFLSLSLSLKSVLGAGGGREQKGAALVTPQKKQSGTVRSLGISRVFIGVFSGVFSPSLARTSR